MTSNPEIEMNRSALVTIRWIAMLAVAFSGGMHLSMVPVQISHSVAHGSFFLVLGLAQVIWAFAFWRFPARVWCFIGLGLSGGIIVLWVLTQLVSVPYAAAAEPINMWLILSKMAEINGLVALVGYLAIGNPGDSPESLISWTVVGAMTLAIGFGVLVWGAGHFAETVVPDFGPGVSIEPSESHHFLEPPSREGGSAFDGSPDRTYRRELHWPEARPGGSVPGFDL
jgi:hypothetical protein